MNDTRRRPLAAAIGFAIALLLSAATHAAPAPVLGPVQAASDANDVLRLEALGKSAATPSEQALAQGTALALRHKDAAAIAILEPLAQNASDKDVRAAAYLAVSSVYMRQSRFAEACKAMQTAKALRAAPFTLEEEQSLDFLISVEGETPMTVGRRAAGKLAVTHDMAGLARIAVAVNGVAIDAVVDSGAGFSTLSESAAKRMGVRLLARGAKIGSASKDTLLTRIGVAERLQFGDAVLNNVVFIVLPDSDLSFAGGAYKIDAIMGLPVFEALGRIEVAKADGAVWFHYGPNANALAPGNLLLSGVEPIALVDSDGGAKLRLFIDTGANVTTLNATLGRDFPHLAAAAVQDKARIGGAGGITEDGSAKTLPVLHLTIAGRSFEIEKVSMRSKIEPGHHGAIGQDILKQGKSWALDFETMSFTVED